MKCPRFPGKVRYRTESAAVRQLARLMQAGMTQRRVYRCDRCHGWHSTTQEFRRGAQAMTPWPDGFFSLITWPVHDAQYRRPYRHWLPT